MSGLFIFAGLAIFFLIILPIFFEKKKEEGDFERFNKHFLIASESYYACSPAVIERSISALYECLKEGFFEKEIHEAIASFRLFLQTSREIDEFLLSGEFLLREIDEFLLKRRKLDPDVFNDIHREKWDAYQSGNKNILLINKQLRAKDSRYGFQVSYELS